MGLTNIAKLLAMQLIANYCNILLNNLTRNSLT